MRRGCDGVRITPAAPLAAASVTGRMGTVKATCFAGGWPLASRTPLAQAQPKSEYLFTIIFAEMVLTWGPVYRNIPGKSRDTIKRVIAYVEYLFWRYAGIHLQYKRIFSEHIQRQVDHKRAVGKNDQDIDKSDVLDSARIESPIFGIMSPTQLSGGVKTLILIANDKNHVFNASNCGDNCAKWLLIIAEKEKIVINLRHLMDFGNGDFKIRVMNTGKIVKNMQELVLEAGELV